MAISKGSMLGREACCFTLAVEQYDVQSMECILYEGNQETGIRCRSFTELAQNMERGFEEMSYPTPSVRKRKFSAERTAAVKQTTPENLVVSGRVEGRLATLRIRVRQCLNATWQGQVSRNEEERDAVLFESFLELIRILDGIFSGDGEAAMSEEAGDTASLTEGICSALLLGARYSGIRVEMQDSPEILICTRRMQNGEKETFAIRPMFRENHTYQGIVCWSEGRQQKNFRSFLELLTLMMSVEGTPVQQSSER